MSLIAKAISIYYCLLNFIVVDLQLYNIFKIMQVSFFGTQCRNHYISIFRRQASGTVVQCWSTDRFCAIIIQFDKSSGIEHCQKYRKNVLPTYLFLYCRQKYYQYLYRYSKSIIDTKIIFFNTI